jgi:putative transposase
MQDHGRDYVRLVNCAHRRSGTLWEGRFHSCLVDTDGYLLSCMRYIESNPVRARMATDAADYHWSSFRSNALGQLSALLTPHAVYLALGGTALERCAAYQALFASARDAEDENALRVHTRQRAAWGSLDFQRRISTALGRKVTASPPGRPRRKADNGI